MQQNDTVTFDYRRDILSKLQERDRYVEKQAKILSSYANLVAENKKLKIDLNNAKVNEREKKIIPAKFNPYLKQSEVDDINTFVHEEDAEYVENDDDEENTSAPSKATRVHSPEIIVKKEDSQLPIDERREFMNSMVQVMRDKAQMMDSMLQLTNYLQDAEKRLEEETEKCELLQASNKKLLANVERFKAEGDYFLVEITRRDEEIEGMDEANKELRQQLDKVTQQYKQSEQKCKELQEVSETQSKFLQEQYKNHQDQLRSIYDQYEIEKARRVKLEQMIEQKFHINPTAIISPHPDKNQNIVQGRNSTGSYSIQKAVQLEQDQITTSPTKSPTSPHSLIHQIKLVKRIRAHNGQVNHLCFNSKGNQFATCGEDSLVKIWDSSSCQLISQFFTDTQTKIEKIHFSKNPSWSNEPMIMGTTDDGKACIWNINKGSLLRVLRGHDEKVHAGVFIPNGEAISNKVMTGSYDRTVKLWDLNTGSCVKTFLCLSAVNDIDVTAQGNVCLSAHFDQQIRLYDTRAQRQVNTIPTTHTQPLTSVSLLQSDQITLLTNSRDNTLKLIDIRMFKETLSITHDKYMCGTSHNKASIRSCGDIITVGSSSALKTGSTLESHVGVICWDLRTSINNDERSVNNWCRLLNVSAPVSQRLSTKTFGSLFGISSSSSAPETSHVVTAVAWNEEGSAMVAAVDNDVCIYSAK